MLDELSRRKALALLAGGSSAVFAGCNGPPTPIWARRSTVHYGPHSLVGVGPGDLGELSPSTFLADSFPKFNDGDIDRLMEFNSRIWLFYPEKAVYGKSFVEDLFDTSLESIELDIPNVYPYRGDFDGTEIWANVPPDRGTVVVSLSEDAFHHYLGHGHGGLTGNTQFRRIAEAIGDFHPFMYFQILGEEDDATLNLLPGEEVWGMTFVPEESEMVLYSAFQDDDAVDGDAVRDRIIDILPEIELTEIWAEGHEAGIDGIIDPEDFAESMNYFLRQVDDQLYH